MDKQTAQLAEEVGRFLRSLLKDAIRTMVDNEVTKHSVVIRASQENHGRLCGSDLEVRNTALSKLSKLGGAQASAQLVHKYIHDSERAVDEISSSLGDTMAALGETGVLITQLTEEVSSLRAPNSEKRTKTSIRSSDWNRTSNDQRSNPAVGPEVPQEAIKGSCTRCHSESDGSYPAHDSGCRQHCGCRHPSHQGRPWPEGRSRRKGDRGEKGDRGGSR